MDTAFKVELMEPNLFPENFFEVFVNWRDSQEELFAAVAEHTGGNRDLQTIVCGPIELDVCRNKRLTIAPNEDPGDVFTNFPYYLEIEMEPADDYGPLLSFVSDLIEFFRSKAIPAVAVGELDEKLPNNRSF